MDASFPDHAQIANAQLIDELYKQYLENPESVDPSWRYFFQGMDFASFSAHFTPSAHADCRVLELIQAYRRYGHIEARTNPLEDPSPISELDLARFGFKETDLDTLLPSYGLRGRSESTLREIVEALKQIYTAQIGFEYMDLGQSGLEQWMQNQIESLLPSELGLEEKKWIFESLNRTEVLELFLHTRYVGQTRFSLEGTETMIPILSELIDRGADLGVEECFIGMAHRGRLNVLANVLNKPFSLLLEEFEDDTTLSFAGNDDVKYHMGFSSNLTTRSGKQVKMNLAANPSHLESVDPVVLGQVRARQILAHDKERKKINAILIHGDASLAGQGVIYEMLQFMKLPAYSTGGTIHLVVNNQIGYTTAPNESRSTRYCTDIAKTFGCPVFHVNAEDPESCIKVARWAAEIRQQFQCDVFIDLIGYRKYGHNEGDEPAFTQPLLYRKIRAKKPIQQIYFEKLLEGGHAEHKLAEDLEAKHKETLAKALQGAVEKIQKKDKVEERFRANLLEPLPTGVSSEQLARAIESFCRIPEGFHPHPKLKKWLQDRLKAVEGNDPAKPTIDWSTAECLAFGSLLMEKIPIRLAGEDCQRGTFSQRHIVWNDFESNELHCSLAALGARFDAVNSPLTEFAGLAFEYGYTWSEPKALVLWEAQYGDFDNGAQIIIDQYLVSAEQKWNTPSSLVLLLPHAYEGAGPEHSSARLERFLQLSAEQNIQVVNASTPAQYFHVLRRQAIRKAKRPLIVFTPKSLLRSPANISPLQDFTKGQFEEVLDDPAPPTHPVKVLFCCGKVFYDLLAERTKKNIAGIAIVRIDQLYPLHEEKLKKLIAKYGKSPEFAWVQEEPENAGAWNYLKSLLPPLLPKGAHFRYIGRPMSPTTATGSHKKHKQEQQALLEAALL